MHLLSLTPEALAARIGPGRAKTIFSHLRRGEVPPKLFDLELTLPEVRATTTAADGTTKTLLELSDGARKWLAQKGFDPLYGARPLARVIQDNIKKPLAEDILFGRLEKGGTVRVDLDKEIDKLVFKIVESKASPTEETVDTVDA